MKKLSLVLFLSAMQATSFADDLGKKTYELACQNCHSPKLAKGLHAPAAFDKKAWDKRFEKAAIKAKQKPERFKSAMDYLLYSVTIGKGLMHHGGLCHESDVADKDCSDQALIAAINYMSQ